jgi:hypothetical protein
MDCVPLPSGCEVRFTGSVVSWFVTTPATVVLLPYTTVVAPAWSVRLAAGAVTMTEPFRVVKSES